MQLKKKTIMVLALSLSILSQGMIVHAKSDGSKFKPESNGKWMTGEYHAHTYQSDDASQSLQELLDNGFEKYGLDWIAVSDHLRFSKRDDEEILLPADLFRSPKEWRCIRSLRSSSSRQQGNTRITLSIRVLNGTCLHTNMWESAL